MSKNQIIWWVTTSIIFLCEGIYPLSMLLFAPEYIHVQIRIFDYSDFFLYPLVVLKITGAFMLMVSNWHPIVKECIYGSVLFNLIFATLAALEEGRDDQTLFGLVLGGLASVSYIYHRKLTDDNSEVRKKIKREDTIV